MRLEFELVDWVEQIAVPTVGGIPPIHRRAVHNKRLSKKEHWFSTWLSFRGYISLLPSVLDTDWNLQPLPLVFRCSKSDWNYTIDSPKSPADLGLLNLQNRVSEFLIVICIYKMYVCMYPIVIYVLLILPLWSAQTNTHSPRQRPPPEGEWQLYSQGQQQIGGC